MTRRDIARSSGIALPRGPHVRPWLMPILHASMWFACSLRVLLPLTSEVVRRTPFPRTVPSLSPYYWPCFRQIFAKACLRNSKRWLTLLLAHILSDLRQLLGPAHTSGIPYANTLPKPTPLASY
ncbi:hypothetical protein PYCCODRAFT_680496 [Trametes coccinea BRFM310]|uniref:Uncharacterized protein n=1 Tax=Trametes coccinea (strain BRFM310) TaxID=1353009 RepID=A0A1Y2IIK5_TRAC3|nr:hypothetical protein PYCCODRAFT_680496 [Trametes coccinea BRFM310]